eukprot:815188-Rhodomonas_salina.4
MRVSSAPRSGGRFRWPACTKPPHRHSPSPSTACAPPCTPQRWNVLCARIPPSSNFNTLRPATVWVRLASIGLTGCQHSSTPLL